MKPCKIWHGARSSAGYGQKRINRKLFYMHRKTWADAHGPIPPGVRILHTCDNRACYELDHLFDGSQMDNIKDAVAKKRHPHGMTHGRRKITDTQAATIRADPRLQKVIAKAHNVHPSLVSLIKSNKIWKG